MFSVYLLKSTIDKGFYIGSAGNVEKRVKKHNRGGVKSTKYRKPLKLLYFEAYASKRLALKREIELKKNSFRKKELIDRFK